MIPTNITKLEVIKSNLKFNTKFNLKKILGKKYFKDFRVKQI